MQGLSFSSLVFVTSLASCTIVTRQPDQQAGGANMMSGMAGLSGASTGDGGAPPSDGGAASSGAPSSTGFGGALATGGWTNVTSNLAGLMSECGNLSALFTKPDEDLLIAGVAKRGLWSSTDGGQTWAHMGEGKNSDEISHRPSTIVWDPDDSNQFWEAGIYGAAAYRTTDDGQNFTLLGDAAHCDLLSVDLSDPSRKTLLAGGHEQSRTLNLSTDSGKTWKPVGMDLPDKTNCTLPLIIDSKTFLVGCGGYGGGFTGIYRSTDGGASWTAVSMSGGASAPLVASDGSIYWATANPGGMARSTDQGETWQDVAPTNLLRQEAPIELPDGRIATLSKDGVAVSADHGANWRLATGALPYDGARSLVYSKQQRAFFVSRFSCDGGGANPVPPDAVMRADFDYRKH
jgi:photosystem II stability/assembly factor-like uncharacterized protein